MARRRRDHTRSYDWVSNIETYNRGTYTVTAGAASKLVLPLTYTMQSRTVLGQGGSVAPNAAGMWAVEDFQSAVSLPSGGSQRVHRVRGFLNFNPSTWAVGNTTYIGVRLMKFELTPDTGQALLDPEYTMWAASATSQAYIYADEKFYFEDRIFHSFSDNKPTVSRRIDVNFGRRGVDLAGDEAFCIYVETDTGSISTRTTFFLRTLMSTDG